MSAIRQQQQEVINALYALNTQEVRYQKNRITSHQLNETRNSMNGDPLLEEEPRATSLQRNEPGYSFRPYHDVSQRFKQR